MSARLYSPPRCRRRAFRPLLLAAVALLMQGCYYLQAAGGQFEIWRKQEALADVIDDETTDPTLARRLRLLRDARDFASRELLLPDNGSYRSYADLGRDYVVWNVMAAPEFSLAPRTWCYLVVGCLAYRGYFDEHDARRLAAALRDDGYDVFVGGVPAYSTLGKFDDPILNTMLAQPDDNIVALLFHELAHQRLYIANDTAFNESFASAVAEFGVQSWLTHTGRAHDFAAWQRQQQRTALMMELIRSAREQLQALYAGALPDAQKRPAKQQVLDDLEAQLAAALGDARPGGSFNNARLVAFDLYRGYLPAFRAMFAACNANWACFYAAAEALADLPPPARGAELEQLMAGNP